VSLTHYAIYADGQPDIHETLLHACAAIPASTRRTKVRPTMRCSRRAAGT
jgi:hypothetical protein